MTSNNEFLLSVGFLVLEGLIAAFFLYQLLMLLPGLGIGNKGQQKAQKWTGNTGSTQASFGSSNHKIAIIFNQLGIISTGKEQSVLRTSQITISIAIIILSLILKLHWGIGLILGIGIPWLAIQLIIDTLWKRLVEQMNDHIPGFISSLSATLQVVPDVSGAIEEVCSIRPPNDLLRQWMEDRVLRAAKSEGGLYAAYEGLIAEAFAISNALGVLIYTLHRYDEAGGGLWQNTLRMVNDNMMTYLQGVGKTRAIAVAARNQTMLIGGICIIIMIFMGSNQDSTTNLFVIRATQLFSLGMMAVGWRVIQNMIHSSLQ